MFIQTEDTGSPETLRFLPGVPVLPSGTASFADAQASERSPLARRLFEIEGVSGVTLAGESVVVRKTDDKDWYLLKPAILGIIMEHFTLGKPVLLAEEGTSGAEAGGEDNEMVAEIKELVDTRIRPVATQSGGDIIYRGFDDGVVLLEFQGGTGALRAQIENMLRHYLPEVTAVRPYVDETALPGLSTPEAKAIQGLLDERINPAVAAHGGYISLIDVQADTAYIRLEGGCQGCGMADVTLKQGVETEIKRTVPTIGAVLDVTDHVDGTNPYYQPGKGGMTPF